MQSAIRKTIILFVILELVHSGFGLILMKLNISGPSDIKDYLFGPLIISALYFHLTTLRTNLNKGFMLGIDGEPFWGNDRRPQIERWLAEGPF